MTPSTCPSAQPERQADAEELVFVSDPQFSLIQKLKKHEEPLWADHVRRFKVWYDPAYNKNKRSRSDPSAQGGAVMAAAAM